MPGGGHFRTVSSMTNATTIETISRPVTPATNMFGPPTRPAPRWAQRAATLTLLLTLPSGLWRICMALGLPVGVDPEYQRQFYGFPGRGTVYVFGLTLLLAGLALMTQGLVHRWGEVAPAWMPVIGGAKIPRLAAIVPATAGAVALTLLWAVAISNVDSIFAEYGIEGGWRAVVTACYLPLQLWGPLLGAVTVSYARRTRPTRRGRSA
jgi:hypothetical protein